MAVIIRHGPAGSYKSATIVFKHVIAGLKEGRIVVTNVEGMYPLDYIKKKTGFKFPDSAQLVRIGSLNEDKQELWRNWFSWMPLDCLIVVDEIQSIYPDTFKKELSLRDISDFTDDLPQNLIDLFHQQRTLITASDFDEGDTDDTGELRFNEDGSIIYPNTLNDAYKRHRKFNWDIVLGTPNIGEVSMKIRSVAEVAFAHRARDEFIFTKRKPRIFQHPPKQNGLTVKKDDVTTLTVPLWSFLCYKSTQTGKQTKSGQGASPFKSPKFILIMGVCAFAIFWFFKSVYTIFIDDTSPINVGSKQVESVAVISGEVSVEAGKKDLNVIKNDTDKNTGIANRIILLASASVGNSSLNLPYEASTMFLTGYAHPSLYIFKFTVKNDNDEDEIFQLNSDDLKLLGWTVRFEDDGLVLLKNRLTDEMMYCMFDPRAKREIINNDDDLTDYNNDYIESDSVSSNSDLFTAVSG